jgi:hypothetical protein
MCNDYEQHVRWTDYRKLMQALDLAIPSHQSELDLPRADDIRINDRGPVMRAAIAIEPAPMTFAFPNAARRCAGLQLSVGRSALRQQQPLPHPSVRIL